MSAKLGLSEMVDPRTSLFELLKVYNQIKSNGEDSIRRKLLESMGIILRRDILSRREFDLVEYFEELFKRAGREDLLHQLQGKFKAVKSLEILLKEDELVLRRASSMCEHQIGEIGEKSIFISEKTLIKEKLRKSIIYSKSNQANIIVNIAVSSDVVQVRIHPGDSVPALIRQIETRNKLSSLRVTVPMGYRIGYMLEDIKLFAIGASVQVAVIVDDSLIFVDPDSDTKEIADKFEKRERVRLSP